MIAERYRVLLAVVEAKSLSGAAERMGYTPSGVSRMIATLEDEAGVKLFNRSKMGVTPTEECLALLPAVKNMIHYEEQYNQIASEFRGLSKGRITIGTSYSSYYRWLTQIIAAFNKEYPNIEVDFIYSTSTKLTEAVIEHEVDIAIVSKREADVEWRYLRSDPMVAWVPFDSPYIENGYVSMDVFKTAPYIELYPGVDTDNKRVLSKFNIAPHIKYTIDDIYAAVSLVEAGLGIVLMNSLDRGSWDSQIAIVPVKPRQYIEIGLITPQNDELSPAARKFIEFAKEKM